MKTDDNVLLEINLISAQGLKPPSVSRRTIHSYAVAWVDSASKLRTRIDRIGAQNPTWNDKFIFRVSPEFLSNDTAAVSIEIYTVGYLKDIRIGTVRFLVGNSLPVVNAGVGIPSFTALQIRRPSGRFHGILNIGAMVIKDSDFTALNGISAIGYRDLMGENLGRRDRREKTAVIAKVTEYSGEDSCYENSSCGDSGEFYSDDGESSSSSTTTNSSSTPKNSTLLKVWNGRRQMNEKKEGRLDGGGRMCWLGFHHKKIHLSPSDQNLHHQCHDV